LLLYATLWKAIVLLDEADVFLETREEKGDNAERNGLVAIFLKELEYFSGIIFLTTNRVETFDAAAEEQGIDDCDRVSSQLSDRKLNGREITNALHTARTIANSEGVKLNLKHILTVLKVRDAFDKSLKLQKRRLASHSESGGVQELVRRGSILTLTEEPEGYT
jgi:hypothetical protein